MRDIRQVLFRLVVMLVMIGSFWALSQPIDDAREVPEWIEESDVLEGGHCVAHEVSVPVQGFHVSGSGFHVSGSVGGMVLGAIEYTDPDDATKVLATVPPLTVNEVLVQSGVKDLVGAGLQADVAIVVADDFANGYLLPSAIYDRTSPLTRDDLESLAATDQISHGALVMRHLNDLIEATGTFVREQAALDGSYTVWADASGYALVVAAVDMSQVDRDETPNTITSHEVLASLGQSLATKIEQLSAETGRDLRKVVVNMSWVFLPCRTVEEFVANKDKYESFYAYLTGIGMPGDADLEEVMKFFKDVNESELIMLLNVEEGYTWKSENGTELEEVTFVGAAGNFAMSYQMLPAGWLQVVGAGVTPQPRTSPDGYSNRSDVTVPGEWISLQGFTNDGGDSPLSYAGTSFASPMVALYVAVDLATVKRCSEGHPVPSKLGDWDGDGIKQEESVPLADAVKNYCLP